MANTLTWAVVMVLQITSGWGRTWREYELGTRPVVAVRCIEGTGEPRVLVLQSDCLRSYPDGRVLRLPADVTEKDNDDIDEQELTLRLSPDRRQVAVLNRRQNRAWLIDPTAMKAVRAPIDATDVGWYGSRLCVVDMIADYRNVPKARLAWRVGGKRYTGPANYVAAAIDESGRYLLALQRQVTRKGELLGPMALFRLSDDRRRASRVATFWATSVGDKWFTTCAYSARLLCDAGTGLLGAQLGDDTMGGLVHCTLYVFRISRGRGGASEFRALGSVHDLVAPPTLFRGQFLVSRDDQFRSKSPRGVITEYWNGQYLVRVTPTRAGLQQAVLVRTMTWEMVGDLTAGGRPLAYAVKCPWVSPGGDKQPDRQWTLRVTSLAP